MDRHSSSPETPDHDGAYPRLSEDQVALLARDGECRRVSPREVLFREGDPRYDFYVVLEGSAAMVDKLDRPDERLLVIPDPSGRPILRDLRQVRPPSAERWTVGP